MSFVTKHMSKKMLSVILALMVLISAVSVAFSAIANAAAVPYVVTMGKPAIAMLSGQTLDLNKINVEFGIEEVPGEEITWAATPDSAIVFDATAKTLTVLKPGSFTLTATKTSDADKTRTINVFATAEATTEVPLYEHTFTADDIADGAFTAASEWKVVKNGTGALEYKDAGYVTTGAATSSYFVLDPLSSSAQILKNFRDLTVEIEAYSPNSFANVKEWYGPIARLSYTDNLVSETPVSSVFSRISYCTFFSKPVKVSYDISGNVTPEADWVPYEGKNVTANAITTYKMELAENTVKTYLNVDNTDYFEATGLSLTSEQQAAMEATVGGTIGFYTDATAAVGLASVKAYINFTQTELDRIQNACEDNNFYIVNPEKPAIPMLSGKTLSLNAIIVEFANGELAYGDKIEWSIPANSAVLFDSANGYLSIFKAGRYELTATRVGDASLTQKIYLFVSDVEILSYEVYAHTFSADDLTAEGAFKADGEWKAWINDANNKWGINNDGVAPLLWNGTAHWLGDSQIGTVYLDPASDAGKLIGAFKDVTIKAGAYPTVRYNVSGNYVNIIAALDLGADNEWQSSDPQIMAGFRVPGGLSPADDTKRLTAIRYNVLGNSSAAVQEFYLNHAAENTLSLTVNSNAITGSVNGTAAAGITLTPEQENALKTANSGTIGFYFEGTVRTSLRWIKAYVDFTAEEVEAVDAIYVDVYQQVPSTKPILPVRANSKIVLDNLVFEMSDGSFKLGKDVVWENNNGAVKVDTADNSISVYTDGFFTVKAKLNNEDEGREIYIVTPDSEGRYKLYEHTFTADDITDGALNEASGWKSWINNTDNKWGFTSDGVAPLHWNGTAHWLGDSQYGGIYLDPASEGGKIVSSFADLTIVAKVTPTVRYNNTGSALGIFTRLDLGADNAWQETDSQIMATYQTPGGLYPADDTKYNTTVNVSIAGNRLSPALKQDFAFINGADNLITVKALGGKMETAIDNGTGNKVIQGITLTDAQTEALNATAGKNGRTVGIYFNSTTRCVAKAVSVYTEFEAADLAKFDIRDIAPLYTVYQNYPAIPMKPATKLDLSKLLIQLPNGDYNVGNELNWETDFVGSGFLIENSAKEIYAYNSGRYDVTIKDAEGNKVLDVHFVVADENGTYKLFDHTFTKADADALSANGKSDLWMTSVHSMKAARDSGLPQINNIMFMANEWKNSTSPLGSNLMFDANKGISMYTNEQNLLVLNPESAEAKIISKFRDYSVDFTASTRDKDSSGNSNWTQYGYIGALGRVDFGADGKLSFTDGSYMPNRAVSYEHNRLTMKEGVVTDLSKINNLTSPGDEYTWTVLNGAEYITIDNEAKTIVASKYGIYNIEGTKEGETTKTVSVIVPHEDYLDHMLVGSFYVHPTSPSLRVNTTKGDNGVGNKYTGNNSFTLAITNSAFSYAVPETYNYRVSYKGNDIAFYVAPNGTANYAELYNSATTALTVAQKGYMSGSNEKSGTIGVYTNGSSRAWFKSISVSLDITPMPSEYLISLGECRDEASRIIYLSVGDSLDLTQINFEAGNRYHNGANITFSNVPAGLTVVNGVSITPNTVGDYTLTGQGTDGTRITITIAVSAAGAIYDNGNYKFTVTDGIITAYTRKDESKPYSEYVKFPSEYEGKHVYELGGALAMGNPNNKQLVSVEIEKYIEKIGSGAFLDANKLEEVIIPNTVESIGGSAFAGTTSLTEVFLPASVSEIGESAFRHDTALVVTIANKDAVIGDNAFSVGATIKGYAGSTAEAYANANGIDFVPLAGADKTTADASVADWEQIVHDRYNKVNTSVEWTISTGINGGRTTYSIVGFKYTDRSAGKFVIPAQIKMTVDGKEQMVSVNPGSAAMADCVDSRAVYALELEEGVTNIGFWAFRGCYNLRDVKLPKTLGSIAQQTFKDCSSLEKIDIPKAVVVLGLYAFENCTSLTEVNVHPDSMLQAIGTNAVRKTEVPGRILYGTQVEKFVFPVSVDWITNSITNFAPKLNEVWIYNKDCLFTIATDAQQYYFNRGTIIHGVPGSTAEELVKADQALGAAGNPNYRGLVFVGDLEDFYEVNEGVKHEGGFFSGSYMQYDDLGDGKWAEKENPYYAVTKYTGKGGSVVMPAYLDILGEKNVPIYAVSAAGFQFETIPTGGLPKIINLEISEGIAVIEDEAFSGAIHMKSVKLPSTLLKIGAKAFVGTSIEGKLELPKNLAEIGNAAFRSNPNLTDIVIYNPNMIIGAGVFDNTITIHGIKGSTAEAYATKNKIKFVEIEAPAQSTVADFTDNGNYKFTVTDGYITGYERIDATKPYSQRITVPAKINGETIKGVAAGAFEKGAEATSVMAIELQEGITEIPKEAFKGLMKLARVSLPKTLKTIGESAFEGTALNGEIVLPESLEKVERNAYKNLNNISAITILSKTVVLDPAGLPRLNKNMKVYGYTDSTAEAWAKSVKWDNFEYLDGGPAEEPGDQPGDQPGDEPGDGGNNNGNEPTEDPIQGNGGVNKVIRVIRQSNLALVIVIAVSLLLLAVLMAAIVVVIVVIKKKRDEEMGL